MTPIKFNDNNNILPKNINDGIIDSETNSNSPTINYNNSSEERYKVDENKGKIDFS